MRPRYKDLFQRMWDPDPVEADAAFDAVMFDREDAVPDIVECYLTLERNQHIRRCSCVQLLGFSGARAAVPTLLHALSDPHPLVRAEACRSLEDLHAHDALPHLATRLDDLDEEVRLTAAEAILGIEGTTSHAET